jgi:hypothetical protein
MQIPCRGLNEMKWCAGMESAPRDRRLLLWHVRKAIPIACQYRFTWPDGTEAWGASDGSSRWFGQDNFSHWILMPRPEGVDHAGNL